MSQDFKVKHTIKRHKTRKINIGSIEIGGDSAIAIQSMTNTDTSDLQATTNQILKLQDIGCDIVRIAYEHQSQTNNLKALLNNKDITIPIVADIQFDYRLAVIASDIGIPKIRFNPGNIGGENAVKSIVQACKTNNTIIRVGVNSGSIDKQELIKSNGDKTVALSNSVLNSARLVSKYGYDNIVLSIKSSDPCLNLAINRLVSTQADYPLHIGITESGSLDMGLAKSYAGLGALLLDGIGDTIRISLTEDPLQEVRAAKRLLRAVGIDNKFIDIVSCPMCSRTKWDMTDFIRDVERIVEGKSAKLKIAIMGCVVNGPGEAKDADMGIAGGGDNKAVVFEKGVVVYNGDMNNAKSCFIKMLLCKL